MGPSLRLNIRKGMTNRQSTRMIAKRKAKGMALIRAANRLVRQAAASARERKKQLVTVPDVADGDPTIGKTKEKTPSSKPQVTSKSIKKENKVPSQAPGIENDDYFIIIVEENPAKNEIMNEGDGNSTGTSTQSKPSPEFLRMLENALAKENEKVNNENRSSHLGNTSIGEESYCPPRIVSYDEKSGVFKDLTLCENNETNQIRIAGSSSLDESCRAMVSAILQQLPQQKTPSRPGKPKKKAPPSRMSATPCTGFHECKKCGKKVSAKKRPQMRKKPRMLQKSPNEDELDAEWIPERNIR